MKRIRLEDKLDFLDYRPGSGCTIEIFDIQVGSERGKGKGRKLVETLLDIARAEPGINLVWAITRTSNFIAQQFYEKLGFRPVAVLRAFYQDEEKRTADAIMFGKDIKRDEVA